MVYDSERLKKMFQIILVFRHWSENEILPLKYEEDGIIRAIKKLPKENRRAIEAFFDLRSKKAKSPFERYMIRGNGEYIWKQECPGSVKAKGEVAMEALLRLQNWQYAVEYDRILNEEAKSLKKILDWKEDRGVDFFLIYLIFFRDGQSLLFDKEGKSPDVKEKVETCDTSSLLHLASENFVKGGRGREIRIRLFEDFFFLFMSDEQKKKASEWIGSDILNEGGVNNNSQSGEILTFEKIRNIKKDLFPRGPWETVEDLVEGRCRKVPGLATLRRASSYEWRHSYDAKFYEPIGEKTLPNGENVKIYAVRGVRSSFHFSDLGEVVFLDHLYERGMI